MGKPLQKTDFVCEVKLGTWLEEPTEKMTGQVLISFAVRSCYTENFDFCYITEVKLR